MIRVFHVYVSGRMVLLASTETFLVLGTMLAVTFAVLGPDAEIAIKYENGLSKILLATAVCMISMYYHDLYDGVALHSPDQVMTRLVRVLGTVCLILAAVYYLWPAIRLSPNLLLLWVAASGIFLAIWRELFLVLNRSRRFAERVAFLGEGPLLQRLSAEIREQTQLGLQVVGCVGTRSEETPRGVPWLGETEGLQAIVEEQRIDRLVLTMADRRGAMPVEMLLHLKSQGVQVDDAANMYEAVSGKVPVESLRLSWLLFSDGFRISHAMLIYKRAISVVFSLLGLVFCLPVMTLIAIIIKLDSPGPAIFRQSRVGKDRRCFTLYKYRTMYVNADRDGIPRPAKVNDSRCTRVGRWLRRSRLDELPQLWNILRGDMYFVGPRPFVPTMEDELEQEIPFYNQRWTIKPGATGWAQIQRGYCYSVEDNLDKLSYDLFYIKNMSIGLDFLILFQTLKILLLGRGSR